MGSVKTTSAVLLAHALGGAVVDTDPQGSATAWGEAAAAGGTPLAVTVTSLPTARLAGRMPSAKHLVIDTPPGDLTITKAAIELADIVLVPTAPTALDMNRVWATLDLTTEAAKPAAVLLVKVRGRDPCGRRVRQRSHRRRRSRHHHSHPSTGGPGSGMGRSRHQPLRLRLGGRGARKEHTWLTSRRNSPAA